MSDENNFKPTLEGYKPLRPFNLFMKNNFPFVENTFEALDTYGLLCEIVKYLNTAIENVNTTEDNIETLQNAFDLLNDYVSHYFDNLDVQEEINEKLDKMATTGVLQELLSQQYDDLAHEVGAMLNIFYTRLNAVASGSPLKATSTSGMTDTTRIYVNTTDGYWYYYNGSSWVQGGVYQSTVLGDSTVHYQNLDTPLKYNLTSTSSNIDLSTINVGVVYANGLIVTTDIGQLGYYEFTVTPFDVYKLHIYIYGFTDSFVCIQLLNNTTVVSNILKSGVTVENNYYDYTLSIPSGVNKIRINTQRAGHTSSQIDVGNYITKVNSYKQNNISKEQLDLKLQSFYNDVYEEITPTLYISDCLMSGTLTSYQPSDIYSQTVTAGEKFKITAKQIYGNAIVFFTTPNKITAIEFNSNSYNIQNFVSVVQSATSNNQFTNYEFTIPEGCNLIYLNKAKNDSTYKIEKVTNYKIKSSDVVVDTNKVGFSKLIAIGDSLTEENFRASSNYLDYIETDIPTLTIQNLGVSGTGYYNDGSPNSSFVNQLSSINSYTLATDVVLVMGSVNDVGNVSAHLGQLGDTTTSTIYGSMYNFFNTLFTTYNGVRVGVVSPLNWKGSENNSSLPLYLKALKDTCELFNIPYLDIHNITNLRPNNDTFLAEYYTADGTGNNSEVDTEGVHPNSKGHRLIYERIKQFICTL